MNTFGIISGETHKAIPNTTVQLAMPRKEAEVLLNKQANGYGGDGEQQHTFKLFPVRV